MKQITLRGSADLYLGVLLLLISGVVIWYISGLEIGTIRRMGSGFFPMALALILAGFGLVLAIRGVVTNGIGAGPITLRPLLLILLSFVVFAMLVDRIGLILAIFAQIAVAHFASDETKIYQSVIFGAVLAVLSAGVFVGLLNMPVELLP